MKTLYGILILTFWLFAACAVRRQPVETAEERFQRQRYPMSTQTTLAQRLEKLQALDSAQIHEVLRLGGLYIRANLYEIFGSELLNIPYTVVIDTLRKTDTLVLKSSIEGGLLKYQELYGNANPANPYEYISKTGIYTNCITKDCKCGSNKLYGRVMVVTSGGWFKVKISNIAELDVRIVTGEPRRCGDWCFVYERADFTVQFVDENEDFTIRFVN